MPTPKNNQQQPPNPLAQYQAPPPPPIDLSGENTVNPAPFQLKRGFQPPPPRKLNQTPGMHKPNPTDQDSLVPNQQGYAPPPSLASVLSALKGGGG